MTLMTPSDNIQAAIDKDGWPRLTFKGKDMRDRLTVTEAGGAVVLSAPAA